jgi:hypothetical protein
VVSSEQQLVRNAVYSGTEVIQAASRCRGGHTGLLVDRFALSQAMYLSAQLAGPQNDDEIRFRVVQKNASIRRPQ